MPNHPQSPPPSPHEELAAGLYEQGFAVSESFLSPHQVEALLQDARHLWDLGEFRFAQVGQGSERQVCPSVRNDQIHWLDSTDLSDAQADYLQTLEELRIAINRQTMLGLFEWEGHLAIYGPGTFYRRHLDVFRHAQERKVSTILYLNQDWTPRCGGELRLYTHGTSLEDYIDIAPRAGTLVTFLSDTFYHEVLPAHSDRVSVTGWFRLRS